MGAKGNNIKKMAGAGCLALAVILLLCSLLINRTYENPERLAQRIGKRIEKRIELLDKYIDRAANADLDKWLELDLPEDMVVYRYVYDSLQSWCNQFPVNNDDISSRFLFPRLPNLRTNLVSPLSDVTSEVKFMNLGSKWYLVKLVDGGPASKIIAGLEVQNTLFENVHIANAGINKSFGVPRKYSIIPVSDSGGIPIYVQDAPMFKILSDTVRSTPILANLILRLLAILCITIAMMLYLWASRRIVDYIVGLLWLAIAVIISYGWGFQSRDISMFFSPTIYADGQFFYSLGALTIMNIVILVASINTYVVRNVIFDKVRRHKWSVIIYGAVIAVLASGVVVYIVLTLNSVIMNSNIPWDLYSWSHISLYTVVTYIMYFGLLFGVLLLLQMLSPAVGILFGREYNVFTRRGVLIFAMVCATYFTVTSSILGFEKEQNRVMVMSNRLAIDRDLTLEINLRNAEESIANDLIISAFSHHEQGSYIILNRLTETYLVRFSSDYDITVVVCNKNDANCFSNYEQRFVSGSPIAEWSRFLYTQDANGRPGYMGLFVYYSAEDGISRVLIDIQNKAHREDSGYYSILGKYSNPGSVDIPINYSYAKYISDRLVRYKGDFAYPTIISGDLKDMVNDDAPFMRDNKYVHFTNKISDDEYIIISRQRRSLMAYLVTFSYLLIINMLIMLPLIAKYRKKQTVAFRRNYYRSRINAALFLSLFVTLVVMTILSVTFVYRRNDSNMYSIMSDKISTIQTLLETQCSNLSSINELNGRDFGLILESIATDTRSDITLYSPNGKALRSTTPEIFDRMLVGSRINEDAYYNIMYLSQRFYINSEHLGNDRYYSLYAPIINSEGKTIAIICVPYAEQNIDFKYEALFHAATFPNIFLILTVITLLISTRVVNNMFKPLIEMGQKMNSADLHGLEYIIYRREDEVSSLVDAYNRMVHDLSESMKKLTRSERDKAWSEMARQVAHEIKNPLTPIKLELQRLIRMKEKNDPAWSKKFDSVSAVILEHIDILTDTANEFSTFAKLYTEEPVEVDLDKTIRDQVMIFDNKENITMSYVGLQGAVVLGPRPQLIRVFVNLITNAIQAIEIEQAEAQEAGREVVRGRINIYLRNGVKDGYYDVVVEDSGPGVREENKSKLFTPNFTTKSSGTGLGLAICRNIVEQCNGEIFYQRSYNLGGACFTVSFPKLNASSGAKA